MNERHLLKTKPAKFVKALPIYQLWHQRERWCVIHQGPCNDIDDPLVWFCASWHKRKSRNKHTESSRSHRYWTNMNGKLLFTNQGTATIQILKVVEAKRQSIPSRLRLTRTCTYSFNSNHPRDKQRKDEGTQWRPTQVQDITAREQQRHRQKQWK